VFLAVHVSLRWLNNFSGVYLVQVSLLLISQQGLAGGLCKLYVTPEENYKYSANHS